MEFMMAYLIVMVSAFIILVMWMCKIWDACVDIRKITEQLEEIKEKIEVDKNEK